MEKAAIEPAKKALKVTHIETGSKTVPIRVATEPNVAVLGAEGLPNWVVYEPKTNS